MPAFAGSVAESYHEIALNLCALRCRWLVHTWISVDERNRHPAGLTAFAIAGADAQAIASRLDDVQQHWPFEQVDTRELIQRIQLEAKRCGDTRRPPEQPPEMPQPPDIMTPLQRDIMKALDGAAMKIEPLANAVSGRDTKRLYKAGGLQELRDRGDVAHRHGVGYYRPDAPPGDLVRPKNAPGEK
jgi:hypothetical protein